MVLREDISRWFEEGVNAGAKWMLISFDELDQKEFATYALSETEARTMESSPRESETVLEVYDLRQPKETQIDMLRCNALERLDLSSHDLARFRVGQSLNAPVINHKRIRSKLKSTKTEEEGGVSDPPANEYAYPSFPFNRIKQKWLFHSDEYITPCGDPGPAIALHGVLGALLSLYYLEGEHWSYAREKMEIGLIKGTSDCGNSSVSMGLASLYFRERDEGVVALINCASAVRFQLYVKSQGNISCLVDQHPVLKASLSNLAIGSYTPRKEQSLSVVKGELKQCFANAPWNNSKLLYKLSKQANLQRDISAEPIPTFAFVTGDLRNHWERLEGKEADEIESTVNGIMESLLGPVQFPPGPDRKPSFLMKQEEEGQVELEGARTMYRQFSIATGYALEPIVCLSVGRTTSMWTVLGFDDPDDPRELSYRQSATMIIPHGMDDEDFGAKLGTSLINTYKGATSILAVLIDSVTRRGNLPLIALKSACLQDLDDTMQEEKSKLTGRERRRALVERTGAGFCPQFHPLVDAPATEHICTHCDQPIGAGMRSCRVCDYDCCYECRPRAPTGQLSIPIRIYVRRLYNPKWKVFDLRSMFLPAVCMSVAGVLTEEGDDPLPQFIRIYMRGQPLTELSGVTPGSVLMFLTGPESKIMKEEMPPVTRAVTTVLQACMLPNGLSSTTLSLVQWKEFVSYAMWQETHGKRLWGESEHTSCLYALAWCYLKGKVVKQNKVEAHRLFLQAANQGNPNSLYFMGSYFVSGATPADQERGVKGYRLLELAANQGVLEARFQLGRCWDEGAGVTKNDKEALVNYRLAADQGHSGAQLMMGVAFLNGKGVAQDTKEAARWLHLAAAQEEHMAHKILMTLSLKGPALKTPPPPPSHSRHTSDEATVKAGTKEPPPRGESFSLPKEVAVRDGTVLGREMAEKAKEQNRAAVVTPVAAKPVLPRVESFKKSEDPKALSRSNSIKSTDEAKLFARGDSSKKLEVKKEEPVKKKEDSKGGASDSFKRMLSLDKSKEKVEREPSVDRTRMAKCLVAGCREDHKKHYCRFCKNDNASHFSSVCPKKPK